MTEPDAAAFPEPTWQPDDAGAFLDRAARMLAATTAAGFTLGALVGGVGGRVAMRILFLTSPDSVRGLESDDGFIIGRFDIVDTLNLISLGVILGIIGALAYLAIRRWLPASPILRAAASAVGAGVVVGSMLVHPEGVDFVVLKPLWLAVGMFVAIPALFGALASLWIDRLVRPDGWFMRGPRPWVYVPFVLWLFPVFAIFIGLPLAVLLVVWTRLRHVERVRTLVTNRWTSVAARAAMLAICSLGALALVRDLQALT